MEFRAGTYVSKWEVMHGGLVQAKPFRWTRTIWLDNFFHINIFYILLDAHLGDDLIFIGLLGLDIIWVKI